MGILVVAMRGTGFLCERFASLAAPSCRRENEQHPPAYAGGSAVAMSQRALATPGERSATADQPDGALTFRFRLGSAESENRERREAPPSFTLGARRVARSPRSLTS